MVNLTTYGIILILFFAILICSPYLFLISQINQVSFPELEEILWALKNSCYQALGSSLIAVILGFIFALGLGKLKLLFKNRNEKIFQYLLLLPSLLPPIFILLAVLSRLEPMPRGFIGISLVQGLMYSGLIAISIENQIQDKLLSLSEMSLVFGCGFWRFWKIAIGIIWRDFLAISLFIFVICFSSFSIPMILGGGQGTTLEILIYEKIKISADWGQAISLSILQTILLFLFAFLPQNSTSKDLTRAHTNSLVSSWTGAGLALSYGFFFVVCILMGWFQGWTKARQIPGLMEVVLGTLPLSFLLSFLVGIILLILLLLTALGQPNQWLHRLFVGFVTPSTTLAGFAFLFIGSNEGIGIYLKYILCFVVLIFSSLYRMGWDQELLSLKKQIETAFVLGAGRIQIFFEITLPQLISKATTIAAIGSLWALGDFALARILIGQDATVAMLSETLMSSYRVEAGLAITSFIALIGLVQFLIFQGIAYVYRRKFI